ncbi:EGF domain-specific O-linked N-acetylglucosamine transferase [Condylostylus longicornis]|uniref:EGF domain-specific O-linked N-acetylglucosamine transferase n=1 Tax=Condylostylus longicornis TaxID=2530218 RepID=UPI00244E29D1|nr:EGF domain-specific O-linked N-acetylglucosamine transferase [Condylostylus longicornis]
MKSFTHSILFLFIFYIKFTLVFNSYNLNLPLSHVQYYFNSFPEEKNKCLHDSDCIYKDYLNHKYGNYNEKACWGYEKNCDVKERFSSPKCQSKFKIEGKTASEIFYQQADFGYVKEQINELTTICSARNESDSFLECSKYLRFCKGKNIYIDLSDISRNGKPFRYKTDVLKYGQIGGHCNLEKQKLDKEIDQLGALQSWAPELRFFKSTELPLNEEECDLIIDKPTILMKLDAQSNMYHHFCDFFNLYLSLHVNQTFSSLYTKDVQILLWETYDYYGPFGETFNAFSDNSIWTLKDLSRQKICFRSLLMPLLPRMIFGLYYNTPIVNNCRNSGLFKAFSEFILYRLKIPLELSISPPKIRITFVIRKTKYRRVLNENELIKALRDDLNYVVKAVSFEAITSFTTQLEVVRNTDILIGMHGAGLTHLLFLPDWATIFELYNCGDPNCYKDLARLRGINYATWEDNSKLYPEDEGSHPDGGAHEKFTNYKFDKKEFLRIVVKAVQEVKNHESYKEFIKKPRIENSLEANKYEL